MRLYDYAASGNCFKARLLLALLERPYERVSVDIFAGETLTDDYARVNPVRETPVLETDDGELIAQSNAIVWYLAEGTPFLPDDPVGRAHVLQWQFDAGFELGRYPAVVAWLDRVRALPGYVNDLEPYPENARPGMGRSIYD